MQNKNKIQNKNKMWNKNKPRQLNNCKHIFKYCDLMYESDPINMADFTYFERLAKNAPDPNRSNPNETLFCCHDLKVLLVFPENSISATIDYLTKKDASMLLSEAKKHLDILVDIQILSRCFELDMDKQLMQILLDTYVSNASGIQQCTVRGKKGENMEYPIYFINFIYFMYVRVKEKNAVNLQSYAENTYHKISKYLKFFSKIIQLNVIQFEVMLEKYVNVLKEQKPIVGFDQDVLNMMVNHLERSKKFEPGSIKFCFNIGVIVFLEPFISTVEFPEPSIKSPNNLNEIIHIFQNLSDAPDLIYNRHFKNLLIITDPKNPPAHSSYSGYLNFISAD